MLVMGGIVFLFAAVMGAGVILARAPGDPAGFAVVGAGDRGGTGDAAGPRGPGVRRSVPGLSYRRIMDLAARINWGTSLPEALERSRKLVSRDAVLLAWVGQAAGTLPRALRMAATTRSNQLPIWTAISARLSYILGLLLVMQTITGVYHVFYRAQI